VFSEVRSQRSEHNMWRSCIKIRPLLELARPAYALLFTLIPCLSRGSNIHSPSGTDAYHEAHAVVVIGVDRHGVGRDNGPREFSKPRSSLPAVDLFIIIERQCTVPSCPR